MLSSLPPIAPRDSHTLWYTPLHPSPSNSGPNHSSHNSGRPGSPNRPPSPRQHHQRRSNNKPPQQTPLALLANEEAAINHRKTSIRRFGYTWLRPAGIQKTMQGMEEERLEREEMEEVERREGERLNAAALGQLGVGLDGETVPTGEEEERDLDDEVPDADAEVEEADGWGTDDDEDEEFAGEDDEEEEEGLREDSSEDEPAQATVADLDDEIPDADVDVNATRDEEEWQHTDTDADLSDLPDMASEAEAGPSTTLGNASAGRGSSDHRSGWHRMTPRNLQSPFTNPSPPNLRGPWPRTPEERARIPQRYLSSSRPGTGPTDLEIITSPQGRGRGRTRGRGEN